MRRSIARSLCLSFSLAILPALASAQSPNNGFADPARTTKLMSAVPAIDRVMRDFAERQHLPGAAWGLIIDGRLVHIGVTGLREIASKSPVDSNTVFRIASMTKSFTAMSILKLRDDGKLKLDDLAEKYVPELAGLKYPSTDSPRLTVRLLLSHAEGFPEDNPWGDQQLSKTDDELAQMLKSGIGFSHAPGIAYEYSNLGFAILGRIVSRASGMPYREYVETNILRPLGMSSTTLSPTTVPANRLAHGYRWEDEQWKEEAQLPDGAFGSMGGMLTSPHDLGIWVSTFLSAWPPRDGPETGPVRRSSLREQQQLSRPGPSTATRDANGNIRLTSGGYGFGLRVGADCNFAYHVSHTGGLPGFGSEMKWLPEYGVGIIAFGNKTYSGFGQAVDAAFAELVKTGGLEPRVPEPSPALVQARAQVTQLVLHWDDQLAKSIASPNLFLDQSIDRRAAAIAALRTTVGACTAGTGFAYVENAMRGRWILPCERGNLLVAITLEPIVPQKVQFLQVTPAPASGVVAGRALCSGS